MAEQNLLIGRHIETEPDHGAGRPDRRLAPIQERDAEITRLAPGPPAPSRRAHRDHAARPARAIAAPITLPESERELPSRPGLGPRTPGRNIQGQRFLTSARAVVTAGLPANRLADALAVTAPVGPGTITRRLTITGPRPCATSPAHAGAGLRGATQSRDFR